MLNDARQQVLQATDIVQLIGQTVALKRRGKSFVGLCPFHQEKTPSFHVNPSRQAFYCFGCKASGTVFDFVMRRDRIEFKDALELLARQANIELPRFGGSQHKPGERQLLLDAHAAACRFFQNLLEDEQKGRIAREYLAKRGFSNETLSRYAIGLAADSWDALLSGPVGRKYGAEVLQKAGLVKPRENGNGYYDTFRNRITFPIRNAEGRTIAFGGRILPGSTDPAKYLNSPETPLFNKSQAIYALDMARQRIVETRTAVVVEGYCDLVVAHQFGARNVVSALGTALTEQHVAILRRYADRIVLVFDADAAGDAAADRVVQLFLTQPIELAVASIPDGLDPDEFLLRDGLEAFDRLLAGATDALSYAWKQLRRKFVSSEGDLTGQQRAIAEYLDLLAGAHGSGPIDPLRWGAALVRVARLTQIPVEELHRRFRGRKPAPRRPVAGHGQGQPTNEPAGPQAGAEVVRSAQERAERRILGILLTEPRLWQNVQTAFGVEDFANPELRRLAEAIWRHQRDEGQSVFNEFIAALEDAELRSAAIELASEAEELADREEITDLEPTLKEDVEYLVSLHRKR